MRTSRSERVTLTSVARFAGVSLTTASQVYSGRRPVGRESRQKVLEAAAALGFRPSSETSTVGVLVRPSEASAAFKFGTAAFSRATGALALECMNRGFNVFVAQSAEEVISHVAHLKACIVYSPNFNDRSLEMLERMGIPTVSSEPDPARAHYQWWAGIDYGEATTRLFDHLIDMGSRHPALLVGETDNSYRRSLLAAYSRATHGVGARPLVRKVYNRRGQAGAKAVVTSLLFQHPAVDSIVTSSSIFAVGALEAAIEFQRCVPEELMLVTASDGPLAEFADIPISALRLDEMQLAKHVGLLLDMRLKGELQVPEHAVVTPVLEIRSSSMR